MTGAANRMGGGSRRKEEKERQKETDTEKHTVTHDQGCQIGGGLGGSKKKGRDLDVQIRSYKIVVGM